MFLYLAAGNIMIRVNKKVVLGLQMFLILGGISCRHTAYEHRPVDIPVDSLELRDGDLVFRMGLQQVSRIVTTLDGGDFSHVGILLQTDSGWSVVHAVPDEAIAGEPDRVKCEPLEVFFLPDRARRGAVLRVACSSEKASRAARLAYQKYLEKIVFDHDYDLNDTTKFYCTELVWFVYNRVGVELTEGRRHQLIFPGRPEWYIFPDDLWQSAVLRLVWYSE